MRQESIKIDKKFLGEQDSQDENGNPIQKLIYEWQELNIKGFEMEFNALNLPTRFLTKSQTAPTTILICPNRFLT